MQLVLLIFAPGLYARHSSSPGISSAGTTPAGTGPTANTQEIFIPSPFIPPEDSVKIDRIEIQRNWITWDRIILNELLFKEGDWVKFGEIDTSINKVRNIGNFANVDYSIQDGQDGNTMQIEALDALQIYPVITIDHSSENDFNYRLGFGDENFLDSSCIKT